MAICMENNLEKQIFQQIAMRDHFNQVLISQEVMQFENYEMANNTLNHYQEYFIDVSGEELRYY